MPVLSLPIVLSLSKEGPGLKLAPLPQALLFNVATIRALQIPT